jgi:hypothetical protein
LGIVFKCLAFQVGGKEQKGGVIYTVIHLYGDRAGGDKAELEDVSACRMCRADGWLGW